MQSKSKILYPIAIATTLVIGIFVGRTFSTNSNNYGNNKLKQLFDLISEKYVDTEKGVDR